ncbi:hypothetical protein DBP26_012650 [Pseudomonas sp. RIT409]|nr:hypothetical protein DBP26_012650 [Pseudomonas sp. RIT 409]
MAVRGGPTERHRREGTLTQSGPNQEQAVFLHFAKTKMESPVKGRNPSSQSTRKRICPDFSHTYEAIGSDTEDRSTRKLPVRGETNSQPTRKRICPQF